MSARRYELTDFEWSIIQPLLPNKPRGVPRADDRKVLNGIYWRLRTGSPWADIPERYGPWQTVYSRFRRWQKQGIWPRILTDLQRDAAEDDAIDGTITMIDSSNIRAHQHAAGARKKGALSENAWDGAAAASGASSI